MPIRRRTGRSRSPRSARRVNLRSARGSAQSCRPTGSCRAPSPPRSPTTRSSRRSTCRSSRARARYGYYKFCRKTGEFAEASRAAVFDPDSRTARIFLGALRGAPQPLDARWRRRRRGRATAANGSRRLRRSRQAAPDLDAVERRMAARRGACARSNRRSRHDADLPHGQRPARSQAVVEPRTHLADFLREHCRLTGTHLGCEHGVCGACTVLIDGEPARSCITFAVACDGARRAHHRGLRRRLR